MQSEKYFSHSWALLTRDKGWIKPLLVMTAASFVPVAGDLGNKGYAMEYARLTAWGVDASPKQKNVDVGKCIASGWRGFVVDLGIWVLVGLALGIVGTLFTFVPSPVGRFLNVLWSMISWLICVLVGVGLLVAEIRAAIYEKISAGYRLGTIFEMIRRDFTGFLKVFLINLACSAIVVLVTVGYMLVVAPLLMPVFMRGNAMRVGQYSGDGVVWMLSALSSVLLPLFIVSGIFCFVMSFVNVTNRIITMNAAGLWMRQFDVPHWGRSEEPLPMNGPAGAAQQRQGMPGEGNHRQAQQERGASHMQQSQPMSQQQPQPQQHQQPQPMPQPQQPKPQEPNPQHEQTQQLQSQQQSPNQQPEPEPQQSWSQEPYVAPSVQHEDPKPVDPEQQLMVPTVAPAPQADAPADSEPLKTPEEQTTQTEASKLEETPKDTFWRTYAKSAPEVEKPANDYVDSDDTASLKRIDVTNEESETRGEE